MPRFEVRQPYLALVGNRIACRLPRPQAGQVMGRGHRQGTEHPGRGYLPCPLRGIQPGWQDPGIGERGRQALGPSHQQGAGHPPSRGIPKRTRSRPELYTVSCPWRSARTVDLGLDPRIHCQCAGRAETLGRGHRQIGGQVGLIFCGIGLAQWWAEQVAAELCRPARMPHANSSNVLLATRLGAAVYDCERDLCS